MNVTAGMLIRFAYDLPDFQISGGPNWLNADRFDLVAKAEGDPPLAQTRLLLRKLLTDRSGSPRTPNGASCRSMRW